MMRMTRWLLALAAAILVTAIGTAALWKHARAAEQQKLTQAMGEALCPHHHQQHSQQ